MDVPLAQIKPFFSPTAPQAMEPSSVQQAIDTLQLQTHMEGGYFVRTDRNPLRIPNPFANSSAPPDDPTNSTRAASSSIIYLLTPGSPLGAWHRNKARTIHTLHRGRGRYVIIHADDIQKEGWSAEPTARLESFVVGRDLGAGERLQWIVEGGKYKGCYLLPDDASCREEKTEGLLITETVVPGFEFCDHEFLRQDGLKNLVAPEQAKALSWMLRETDDEV